MSNIINVNISVGVNNEDCYQTIQPAKACRFLKAARGMNYWCDLFIQYVPYEKGGAKRLSVCKKAEGSSYE